MAESAPAKRGGGSLVALRVAVPERIRAVAIACVAAGIALLEESAVQGWVAWVGSGLFSVGVALFDGLGEGRLGGRQAGMVMLLMGLAGATWASLVIILTRVFLETPVSPALYAVLALSLTSLGLGAMLRRMAGTGRWPRLGLAREGRSSATARSRAA
jgi:hypothetical protein